MFTKLFSSIVHSSIWLEDLETKVLWITMLALMDRHGCVYGSVGGIAHTAGISSRKAREILDKFLSPDPDSADLEREPERAGRRIEVIGGGWRILNATHYRAIRDAEERREQNRSAKAAQRARDAVTSATAADSQRKSAPEAEAEAEADKNPHRSAGASLFDEFWKLYPKRVGKGAALRSFAKLRAEDVAAVMRVLPGYPFDRRESGRFIPHPATWLNHRRWEDDVKPISAPTLPRLNLAEESEYAKAQLAATTPKGHG